MRSPVFVQAIADAVGASSVRLCWTSPDRDTPAPPPESGLPAGRQYPDGEHYREIAGKLRDVARQCRFPYARRELLHLAANYERRGNYIDSQPDHGFVWKERLAAARNAAGGAVRAPAPVFHTLSR